MIQTELVLAEPSSSSLATLEAMARLAAQSATVVHVVVAREPGIVDRARGLANALGVDVQVDLMPRTVRLRFDGQFRLAR